MLEQSMEPIQNPPVYQLTLLPPPSASECVCLVLCYVIIRAVLWNDPHDTQGPEWHTWNLSQ